MTLKSLSTQFNEIVFLQHIQTIKIEDADTYFKSVGYPDNYGSSYEAVLTATLDNGDVVELAEYEDYNTCEDIFQSIAVWASFPLATCSLSLSSLKSITPSWTH